MNNTLGTRVKELRESMQMSMDELAAKLGYKSRASIGRIENGETDLPVSKVAEIAKALHTKPAYLMGWTDDSGHNDYYDDPAAAEVAQEVFDNPDLRLLFDAAKDSKPEDLRMAADMLKRFKGDDD